MARTQPQVPVGDVAAPQSNPATLSIFALSRAYRELWHRLEKHDLRRMGFEHGSSEYEDADAAWTVTHTQACATDELILTSPVGTLTDAAALAIHGHGLAERNDTENDEIKVLRVLLGRLAVFLTDAAGIDLESIGSGGYGGIYRDIGATAPGTEPGAELIRHGEAAP